jgi:hypothetical protein
VLIMADCSGFVVAQARDRLFLNCLSVGTMPAQGSVT